MKPTHIYALIDPITGHARYVGKTIQTTKQRLAAHLSSALKNAHTHCARWIIGLLKEDLVPEVEILETAAIDWQEAECFWIAYMRYIGCELTNHTAGGDGLSQYRHTSAARLNMSIAQKKRFNGVSHPLKGVPRSEEVKRKIRDAQKGRQVSQERREKIAAALRGRKLPKEVVEKVAATHRGMKRPPRSAEWCKQHSETMRGRKRSPEAVEKSAAALRGVPKSEEHRRKLSEAARRRHKRDQPEIPL